MTEAHTKELISKAYVNAHRDGLEVSVSGELDMSERYWVMNNVTNFSPIIQRE